MEALWQFQLIAMYLFTFSLSFLPLSCSSVPFIKIYVTIIELEKEVWKSLKMRGEVLFQMQIKSPILFAGQLHRLCWNSSWEAGTALQQAEGKEERQLLKLVLLAKEVIFLSQTAHFYLKKMKCFVWQDLLFHKVLLTQMNSTHLFKALN